MFCLYIHNSFFLMLPAMHCSLHILHSKDLYRTLCFQWQVYMCKVYNTGSYITIFLFFCQGMSSNPHKFTKNMKVIRRIKKTEQFLKSYSKYLKITTREEILYNNTIKHYYYYMQSWHMSIKKLRCFLI